MTEIMGNDDAQDQGAAQGGPEARTLPAPAVELLGTDIEADEADADDEAPARVRAVLGALTEPASLAVASALALVTSVAIGPSYAYAAYPFNQGLTSLSNVFGSSANARLHPLQAYISSVAPGALLVLFALAVGLLSLLRGRAGQPGWVRAVGAGATIVAAVLVALVVLGAWQSSTYDLKLPSSNLSGSGA